MIRFRICVVSLLLVTGAFWLSMNGCGGGSSPSPNSTTPPTNTSKIQHVVIIFQENRTPDNLFQDPVLISRGADIQSFGIDTTGAKVPLTAVPLASYWDNLHDHAAFVTMYDGGKMDGAGLIPEACAITGQQCVAPANRPFNYVDPTELVPYFTLAETYAFGDRFFQTNQGPSFVAHHIIISGTSAPTPPGQPLSNFFVAENAGGGALNKVTGCLGVGQTVSLIDPTNMSYPANEQEVPPYSPPCFDHPTLIDLLETAGIGWNYYASFAGVLWNGPTEIKHICQPGGSPLACTGALWNNHERIPPAEVLTDIQNSNLASVVWVTPNADQSDHAGAGPNSNEGPAWVASIVNAIGNSSYWANTAIILTWDDWGGWYDHVPPTILNSYQFGFRVPLVVISPYAKAGYISHQVNDFGSVLKFIEETFNLGNVAPGATPAYADTFTNTADLSDFFDFNQTPLTFKTIQADHDASYFQHDNRPLQDPDPD
jgi:phospholipase C